MSDTLRLISAANTALTVERALTVGDEPSAIRHLTEAVSRLIQAPRGAEIPDAVLEVPHQIEDVRGVSQHGWIHYAKPRGSLGLK